MNSFSVLFREFCYRSKLLTVTDFLNLLSTRGFFFEESLIYKWRSGTRLPASRGMAIVLISLFKQCDLYFTQLDANKLLASLEFRDLSYIEVDELFGSLSSRETNSFTITGDGFYPKFSEWNIDPDSDFTIIEVDTVENAYEREEWYRRLSKYFAQYYSFLSCGRKTVDEVYEMQLSNNFEYPREGHTLLAYYAHKESRLKYLVGTVRLLPAYSTDYALDLLHYFDVNNADRYISNSTFEVDRVFIPDWAWNWKSVITEKLFRFARQHAYFSEDGMYAILSRQLGEIFNSSGLVVEKMPDTDHLATKLDAQSHFSTAYQDWYFFNDYWKLYSAVYRLR